MSSIITYYSYHIYLELNHFQGFDLTLGDDYAGTLFLTIYIFLLFTSIFFFRYHARIYTIFRHYASNKLRIKALVL